MKAVIYSEPRNYSVADIPKPQISENQLLIKVHSCGVCRTDIHLHEGEFLSSFPLVPGHEFAGEVVQVGSETHGFKVGDRVVADNTVLCGECYFCRRNQPLYCENFYSLGCNGPGGFAEFVKVNYDKVFHIGDELSYEAASFTEPTACAVHGMDMIDLKCGDDVLIFGAGPTGIILTQLIKHGGAGNVVVVASNPKKLDLISANGYAETIKMDRNDYSKHTAELKSRFPHGFDVVIDATGSPEVLEQSFNFAKKGAKIVVYGVAAESDTIKVSPYKMFANEYKLIGSYAQTHCFDRALMFLEKGIVKVEDLITDRFSLDEFPVMLDKMFNGKENIKILINP